MKIAQWRSHKRRVRVNGLDMAYVEMGVGRPIVFQHGNPTSSYLWRHIMPHLTHHGRCIAVDLVGMGDSSKLPDSTADSYSLKEHERYLYSAWEALGIERDVTFVLHDWGTALGFEWCRQHPQAVRGVAHMEGFVKQLDWDEWPGAARPMFERFRSPAGEAVLDTNELIETVFPSAILRDLSNDEMEAYRAPFLDAGESRRPTISWPRQLPLDGSPPEVCATIDAYGAYMRDAPMPKLFIEADPGMIMRGSPAALARAWRHTRTVKVPGLHFIQEDSAAPITTALDEWLTHLDTDSRDTR